jgi:2-O-methyltransferase
LRAANVYYEDPATFQHFGNIDILWLQQRLLPYNPVIIDIGAYYGAEACRTSKIWPKGKVYAFEPNPRAFEFLERTIDELGLDNIKTYNLAVSNFNGSATLYLSHGPRGDDVSYEHQSSLLPPSTAMKMEYQGPHIEVPCVVLDDWCLQNQIDHVDILRVETEGFELQILQSSTNVLKNTKMIIVQLFFSPLRKDMTDYCQLKSFLADSGFVFFGHWYTTGLRGLAVYVSVELSNAFVHCLGLGSGGPMIIGT